MDSNRYNILDFQSGTEETGPEYPQVQGMGVGYNFEAPDSIYQLAKFQTELPPFAPNLNFFTLHKKAKPTDLLSNSLTNSTGFIISNRFMDLLAKFRLPEHKFFPTVVQHYDQTFKNYFWLQVIADYTNFVDYQKSVFFIFKNYSKDLGNITVSSKNDYQKKREELKSKDSTLSIWAKQIVMTEEFDHSLDLFHVSRFNSDFFISEKLSRSITENELTGLVIKPSNMVC